MRRQTYYAKRVTATWTILVLAATSACGGDVTSPNTTPLETTTTTAMATVEQFAFIRTIDDETITYDPARFLSGEEAIEAAREDGVIGEGETLDTDFYISNPETDEVEAQLDPDGDFVLIGFDANGGLVDSALSLEEFVAVLNGANSEDFYGVIPGQVTADLTVVGDTVVAAKQVYLP
ncbi:MAG: hypothetical protein ACRDWH_10195 [Acidimicrobiia bacterium]